MKTKAIHLFFLILTGLAVGWRELTSATKLFKEEEVAITNWQQMQEVGSTTEASTVLLLFLSGAVLIFVINGLRQIAPKLSSPNSV